MKRFYKTVGVREAADGYGLVLDDRPMNTPAKRPFVVPGKALAEALAEEWERQEQEIRTAAMPLTQLACTAVDVTGPNRAGVEAEAAAYGGNDLLCYRAEHPDSLRQRQHALWQPLLDWAAMAYDAPLAVTSGVMAVPQPEKSLEALARALRRLDDFALTALSQTVKISGSLVLALALERRRLTADALFAAAEVDETYQIEMWGEDPLATQRRGNRLAELRAAERFLQLSSCARTRAPQGQ